MDARAVSRRAFVGGALALGAAAGMGATPAVALPPGAAPLPVPPAFPAGIDLAVRGYENWSQEIVLDAVWTCVPRSAEDVVRLANWAVEHGYTVRARGAAHGWAPLTVVPGAPVDKVVLVDTTVHLNSVQVGPGTVTAGAGATLDAVLGALKAHGLGWVSVPAPGVLTVGGALAVGAHGAALPADGEVPAPGVGYGSLSNLVTALTAVVWDGRRYALRELTRADPAVGPLLVHLGRAFVTSVTLRARPDYRLRCESTTGTPWWQLFAPGGAFERALARSGRAEAIWFPFTDNPWLKVWTPTPVKPPGAREVGAPYNYPFSDTLPEPVTALLRQLTLGALDLAPAWGQAQLDLVRAGLAATASADLWGWSMDTLLYIRPTTLRLTEGGGAVLTSRADAPHVADTFARWFHGRVGQLRAAGQFPVNGPVEIRCCGLDETAPGQAVPVLSALRPRPDRPHWDTAVWLNVLSTPGSPGMHAFYREMEQWLRATFDGGAGLFRPEWSKGFAFTGSAAYQDLSMLGEGVPAMYRAGYAGGVDWDSARAGLDALDPHRVFSNTFLDRLLP